MEGSGFDEESELHSRRLWGEAGIRECAHPERKDYSQKEAQPFCLKRNQVQILGDEYIVSEEHAKDDGVLKISK